MRSPLTFCAWKAGLHVLLCGLSVCACSRQPLSTPLTHGILDAKCTVPLSLTVPSGSPFGFCSAPALEPWYSRCLTAALRFLYSIRSPKKTSFLVIAAATSVLPMIKSTQFSLFLKHKALVSSYILEPPVCILCRHITSTATHRPPSKPASVKAAALLCVEDLTPWKPLQLLLFLQPPIIPNSCQFSSSNVWIHRLFSVLGKTLGSGPHYFTPEDACIFRSHHPCFQTSNLEVLILTQYIQLLMGIAGSSRAAFRASPAANQCVPLPSLPSRRRRPSSNIRGLPSVGGQLRLQMGRVSG